MGRRAPAGAACVGADRQWYKIRRDSCCRAARRTTGRQIPIERMPRGPEQLVFATFTGSWEEAHKAVLVPAFRKANADASIVLDPMLSVDQIAKGDI